LFPLRLFVAKFSLPRIAVVEPVAPRIAARTQFTTSLPARAAIAPANEIASVVPAMATGSPKYVRTPVV